MCHVCSVKAVRLSLLPNVDTGGHDGTIEAEASATRESILGVSRCRGVLGATRARRKSLDGSAGSFLELSVTGRYDFFTYVYRSHAVQCLMCVRVL